MSYVHSAPVLVSLTISNNLLHLTFCISLLVHVLQQCLHTPYVLQGGGCTETQLSHFLLTKVHMSLEILLGVLMCSRDRLVVRTLRCGRNNPGSNPGLGIFFSLDIC